MHSKKHTHAHCFLQYAWYSGESRTNRSRNPLESPSFDVVWLDAFMISQKVTTSSSHEMVLRALLWAISHDHEESQLDILDNWVPFLHPHEHVPVVARLSKAWRRKRSGGTYHTGSRLSCSSIFLWHESRFIALIHALGRKCPHILQKISEWGGPLQLGAQQRIGRLIGV
jgi:hypothetical protein